LEDRLTKKSKIERKKPTVDRKRGLTEKGERSRYHESEGPVVRLQTIFIICSGTSDRQVKAIASWLQESLKKDA